MFFALNKCGKTTQRKRKIRPQPLKSAHKILNNGEMSIKVNKKPCGYIVLVIKYYR